MKPASRTPEGSWQHCPVCGKRVCIELSSYPTQDAPCPHCGQLLWFTPTWPPHAASEECAPTVQVSCAAEAEADPFGSFERTAWAVLVGASSAIVWLDERSPLTTSLWLLGIILFGQLILPPIFRLLHSYNAARDSFWLSVLLGWALVAGLPVGILLGVLIPYVEDCGISSATGGLCGLLAGPFFAALEGLAITSLICGIIRLVTGKSLTERTR